MSRPSQVAAGSSTCETASFRKAIEFEIPNSEVSVLPLQSLRIPSALERARKLKNEVRYIALGKFNRDSAPGPPTRIAVIKNVVFRPKLSRVVSEEKVRQTALEETLMLERQRRLHKTDLLKKHSKNGPAHHHTPKFKRKQDPFHSPHKFARSHDETPSPLHSQLTQPPFPFPDRPRQKFLSRIEERMQEQGVSTVRGMGIIETVSECLSSELL